MYSSSDEILSELRFFVIFIIEMFKWFHCKIILYYYGVVYAEIYVYVKYVPMVSMMIKQFVDRKL